MFSEMSIPVSNHTILITHLQTREALELEFKVYRNCELQFRLTFDPPTTIDFVF